MILKGLKPRLHASLARAPGAWVDELPAVLWSIRTTPNRSTGYTPFFLVYGAEAVLPTDIEHDSPRVAVYDEADNESAMQVAKDLLEEEQDLAASRSAIYQQNLRRYHSRRVRGHSFNGEPTLDVGGEEDELPLVRGGDLFVARSSPYAFLL
jgi:hypothetical protein